MSDCDRELREGGVLWRGGEGCASLAACEICGSLKEVLFQALGDPQVRRSSLRTHWSFPPYRAGNSGH